MEMYSIVDALKDIIDEKSMSFLDNEPYETYLLLIDKGISAKDASIVLLALLNEVHKVDEKKSRNIYEWIESECGLAKDKANDIANIFSILYSCDNIKRWKNKELSGLKEFMAEDFKVDWHGFAVWDAGNGTIDCHYDASFTMHPKEDFIVEDEIKKQLEKNLFIKREIIAKYYERSISEYLDEKFDYYCTYDDYYEPACEDYDVEDDIKNWCENNCFELIECDGNGYDDGYEPKFRNYSY